MKLPHHPLSERYVNLSDHTAPISPRQNTLIRPLFQCANNLGSLAALGIIAGLTLLLLAKFLNKLTNSTKA